MTCPRPQQTTPLTRIERGTPRPKARCATDCTSPLNQRKHFPTLAINVTSRFLGQLLISNWSCKSVYAFDPGCSLNTTAVQWDVKHKYNKMSRHMGKQTICICENKGADQLRSNCEADQRLCFRYSDNTFLRNFKILALFCDCTGRFMSDLIGNHIVGFPTRRLKLFV